MSVFQSFSATDYRASFEINFRQKQFPGVPWFFICIWSARIKRNINLD